MDRLNKANLFRDEDLSPAMPKIKLLAYAALFIAPALFTTNIIFGKLLLSVEPFTLAFIRWSLASLILFVLCKRDLLQIISVFRKSPAPSLFAGFLAFWVCGGMVYFALHHTTATNGTLIYTTPPILILAIEAIWRGRAVSVREVIGILLAVSGTLTIISKADVNNLLSLQFNYGDLIFVAAAVSWAIYSVMLKSKHFEELPTLPLLALFAICGSLILSPFAAYEILTFNTFPTTGYQWSIILAIVMLSSLFSFLTFQFGVKVLGASIGGIFMYLLPPWGLFFAWLLLGETFEIYHGVATALIMSGIIFATFPKSPLKRTD